MKCLKCKYFKHDKERYGEGWCTKDRDEEDCKNPYKSAKQKEADSWGQTGW